MTNFDFFEEEPGGPGIDPTDHPDFDDAPQFTSPGMFGGVPYAPSAPQESETILPSEEMPPEDEFDPRADSDITGLMFLGFLTSTVDLFGHSVVLRSLDGNKDLAVAQIIDEQPGLASQGKALMYAQTAAALVSVDGRSVVAPLNDSYEQVVATIRRKIDYLLKWAPPLVEALHGEYMELSLRVDQALKDYESKLTAGRPQPLP